MEYLAFTCKVCHKGGIMEFDPCGLPIQAAEWATMLSHQRCTDYVVAKKREQHNVGHILDWLQNRLKRGSDTDKIAAKEKARLALVKSTKAYCRALAIYYRKIYAWEPDMVTRIMNSREWWLELRRAEGVYSRVSTEPF